MAVVVMAILVVVKEGVKSCVCGAGIRGSGGLVLGYWGSGQNAFLGSPLGSPLAAKSDLRETWKYI